MHVNLTQLRFCIRHSLWSSYEASGAILHASNIANQETDVDSCFTLLSNFVGDLGDSPLTSDQLNDQRPRLEAEAATSLPGGSGASSEAAAHAATCHSCLTTFASVISRLRA